MFRFEEPLYLYLLLLIPLLAGLHYATNYYRREASASLWRHRTPERLDAGCFGNPA